MQGDLEGTDLYMARRLKAMKAEDRKLVYTERGTPIPVRASAAVILYRRTKAALSFAFSRREA